MFPHGVVEISDTKNGNNFKVNGQHLKPLLESVLVNETAMGLFDQCISNFPLLHSILCIYTFLSYIGDNAWDKCGGEDSNMTNITKKKKKYIYNFFDRKEQYFDIFFVRN